MSEPVPGPYVGLVNDVPIGTVHHHPDNARQGDIGLIAQSLTVHGQYRAIVVNQRSADTGWPEDALRPVVVAGNHTLAAARSLGWDNIRVEWIDVNADQEKRILLIDNAANDAASYDDSALADLLVELATTPLGLEGTGYTPERVDEILADLDTSGFAPVDVGEQSDMDNVSGDFKVECPHCGEKFNWGDRANR